MDPTKFPGKTPATLTCSLNNIALLLSDVISSGWSGPRAFSVMSIALKYKGSASSYFACKHSGTVLNKCMALLQYNHLFKLERTTGTPFPERSSVVTTIYNTPARSFRNAMPTTIVVSKNNKPSYNFILFCLRDLFVPSTPTATVTAQTHVYPRLICIPI